MIDFNLLGQGGNPGNAFAQGFQQARGFVKAQQQENALIKYAQNPNNTQALGVLAQSDPRLAFQIQRDRMDKDAERAKLAKDEQAKKVEAATKTIGNAALAIAALPESQRAQAWDQQIDNFVAQGFDGLAPMKGRYSPAALQSAIAQAGMSSEYVNLNRNRYISGGNGSIYEIPAPGVGGAPQVVGQTAQPARGPQPGQVEDGYRFKGGNPADPNAWEPVGGAPSQGGATFP